VIPWKNNRQRKGGWGYLRGIAKGKGDSKQNNLKKVNIARKEKKGKKYNTLMHKQSEHGERNGNNASNKGGKRLVEDAVCLEKNFRGARTI